MAKYIKQKKVYEMLHEIGGCDAEPESWADGWDKAIDTAIDKLEKIPAADVQEVKHGEWIVVGSSATQTHKAYRCSNCRRLQYYIPCDRPMYCSCCGAKMDGKDNK